MNPVVPQSVPFPRAEISPPAPSGGAARPAPASAKAAAARPAPPEAGALEVQVARIFARHAFHQKQAAGEKAGALARRPGGPPVRGGNLDILA